MFQVSSEGSGRALPKTFLVFLAINQAILWLLLTLLGPSKEFPVQSNNVNTRKRSEICSKLTTLERRQ